jgi:hypothetical protein
MEEANQWVSVLTKSVAAAEASLMMSPASPKASSSSSALSDSIYAMDRLEGHLKKMSPKKLLGQAVWQNRLFRLNPARKTFAYFTEDGSKALSVIPLDLLESVVPHAQSDKRFTVVLQYTPPRLIHLLASSPEEASRWVARLTAVAAVNAKNPRAGSGSAVYASQFRAGEGQITHVGASEQMQMPSRQKLAPLHMPDGVLAAQLAEMKEGAWFKRYVYDCLNDTSSSTTVFVFMNRNESCLYWTEEGCVEGFKNKDKKQCVEFKFVSDLVAGCSDRGFFADPPAHVSCSFTLASKKQEITANLEAPHFEQAQAWLSALHTLITNQRRKKDKNFSFDKADGEKLFDPGLKNQLDLMNAGNFFCRYQFDERTRQVVKSRIYLRYAHPSDGDELGSLWWGPGRDVTPDQSLPLLTVASITIGKQAPEFQTAVAKKTDHKRCYFLMSLPEKGVKGVTLALEAESAGKMATWHGGIHRMISSVKVVSRDDDGDDEPTGRADRISSNDLDIVTALKFNKYTLVQEGVSSRIEQVKVWYVPGVSGALGTVCWGPGEEMECIERAECSVLLSDISDMYLGRQNPAYGTPQGAAAVDKHSFTLFLRHTQLSVNLEATSHDLRTSWISTLHSYIIDHRKHNNNKSNRGGITNANGQTLNKCGRLPPPVPASTPASNSTASPNTTINGSTTSTTNSTGPAASTPLRTPGLADYIKKGHLFTKFDATGVSKIMLFYRLSAKNGMGYLFWRKQGSIDQDKADNVPLKTLKEIIGGKQSKVLLRLLWKTYSSLQNPTPTKPILTEKNHNVIHS